MALAGISGMLLMTKRTDKEGTLLLSLQGGPIPEPPEILLVTGLLVTGLLVTGYSFTNSFKWIVRYFFGFSRIAFIRLRVSTSIWSTLL